MRRGSGSAATGNPTEKAREARKRTHMEADAGVTARVTAFGKEMFTIKRADLSDAEDIQRAFYEYLDLCDKWSLKPMLKGLASVLGIRDYDVIHIANNDVRVANFRGGILTPESREAIGKCYAFLAVAWEMYLTEEKGNPVKWIFLGKNYFGMRDQVSEVQVSLDVKPQLRSANDVIADYAAMVGRPHQRSLGDGVAVEYTVEDDA